MSDISIVRTWKKKSFAAALTLSAAAFAFAQQKASVTGVITDGKNNPVPYASITFKSKVNMAYSDAALADEAGRYTLQLMPGTYDIVIEAIDYKPATYTKQITGGNIGALSVEAEASTTNLKTEKLEGVVITANSRPLKVDIDKKTYDPSQDIVAKGGTLQDVLQNVPSVAVETDGTVSVRGNSNVRFLINGKPSALLGIEDGANALQSIPADQIERIEVITNPSARFEAAGTAGILNIILKKTKKAGFNGSVTGTLGYLPQTSLNTNLGWRKGDLSVFLNGGGGYRENRFTRENDQWFKNAAAGSVQEFYSRSETNNNIKNANATLGIAYDFSPKTSATLSGTVRGFESEGDGTIDQQTSYVGQAARSTVRDQKSGGKNFAWQTDFSLDHKFDDKGQLLSLSASLQNNNSFSESSFAQRAGTILQAEENFQQGNDSRNFVGKADYELPLGEKSKLEAGYRIDINKNTFENVLSSNPVYANTAIFNNNTTYKENFNAGYIQFKSRIGEKLGYQLGLRDEYSVVDINYKNENGESVVKKKEYNGIFPSIYLAYDLNKGSQLLLNYTRRIDRPRSFFLVPYAMYSNPENVFEGNVDLNPSYVDSYELGYSLQKGKVSFNPTLYFRHTNDDVKMYAYQRIAGENVIYSRPINLGTEDRYGLDLNFSYDPISWLKLMGTVGVFGYKTTGEIMTPQGILRDFSGDGISSTARLNTTFRIDKTFSMQLQGFFRGGQKTATTETKPMYALNFGLSKTIWDGNGTITFNVQDIFNTRNRTMYSYTPQFDSRSYMQWTPRQISLSLSYRFNQGDRVEQPRRKKDINNNVQGGDDVPPM